MTHICKLRTLWAAMVLLAASGVKGMAATDATLNRLEVKVGGVNVIPDFNPATRNYEIELGEDAASIATFSAAIILPTRISIFIKSS